MKKETVILLLIFLMTLSLRLFFSFQTASFTGDDSYFALRQAAHIAETGRPLFDDPLSYGGRTHFFTPLFYYLLAFFDLFLPIALVGKLIPNLFASLAVFPIFLICHGLTKDNRISLFAAFVVTFIPIFFASTVNAVTPYSLLIPLLLFLINFFLHINKGFKYQVLYIIFLLAALVTHPASAILVLGLLIFIMLMKLERMKVHTAEIELTLFSTFFLLWFYFLLFKKAFLLYGAGIIFQNIPSSILARYFIEFDILTVVTQIGVIPFMYGIYIIYRHLFKQRSRNIFLILGFIFAAGILLWLKLIPFANGLVFLGIFLVLLMSVYLRHMLLYLGNTRFARFENLFIASLIIAFITTSFIPTISATRYTIADSFSSDEIAAFNWIRDNLDEDAVILASPDVGHLITGISGKKNVIDSNFLFIDDIDAIFEDVNRIYSTKFETQAIEILGAYDVTHIYVSPRLKEYYGIEVPEYLKDENCFRRVFRRNSVQIFHSLCVLER